MKASSEHQVLHVKMFDTRFVHSSAPKHCVHSPFSILLGSRTEVKPVGSGPRTPQFRRGGTAKELGGCRPAILLSVPWFPHKQSGGNTPQLLGLKECRPVRRFKQGALGSENLWGLFEPSCKKTPRTAPLEEVHSPPSRIVHPAGLDTPRRHSPRGRNVPLRSSTWRAARGAPPTPAKVASAMSSWSPRPSLV